MQPQSIGQLKPEAAKIITQIYVRALLRARRQVVVAPNPTSPNLNLDPNLTSDPNSKLTPNPSQNSTAQVKSN